MKKTMRNVFWLIVGFALILTIPWLLVTPALGASLGIGGGQVSPHSYSGNYGLDKGWHFSASLEDLYYENDQWGANVGILYVCSRYKKHENLGDQRRHTVNSQIAALYTKPYYNLTEHIKPFIIAGGGVNFADSTEPCGLLGGGLKYIFSKAWSLEGKFLYVIDPVKIYRMPTLSARYEF